MLKTGNGGTSGWCESVARSAGGFGVVVGLGDSVEDLGGEDFVLEEGGGRWDGGREERGEMLRESGDFAGVNGRRELGREGMWDQEGAEMEKLRGKWSEDVLLVSTKQERSGKDCWRVGEMRKWSSRDWLCGWSREGVTGVYQEVGVEEAQAVE